MKEFDDEIELKKALDDVSVRYGDTYNDFYFLCFFRDNKGDTVIAKDIFSTPIAAVRTLGTVIKQTNLPADDIDIILSYAIPQNIKPKENPDLQPVFLGYKLSPYLYYKKPEEKNEEKNIENKE